jgi:penicillin-binding protein 1C
VATNFYGFEPENFDRKFNGKVSIEFALANSLNIPAVKSGKRLRQNKPNRTIKNG